ncbi:MAG: serine--tRNA ligase [Planctomycetes bacterium]|nr:serine--tRNA ligase [Planctomycetota bacterium]
MLDPRFILENKELVKQAQKNKGQDDSKVDKVCDLYNRRREIQAKLDQLRHDLKKASEEFAKLSKAGGNIEQLKSQNQRLRDEIKALENEHNNAESSLDGELAWLTNIPHETVPIGKDEKDNAVAREPIKAKHFDFKPKDHVELGSSLGIIDWDRQTKLAGSNFLILKGKGAALERALINFMLDFHTKRGYTEFTLPHIVQERVMFNSCQLPKFREDMYELTRSDGFLIPTAEVPLVSIHMEEILEHNDLPKKYTAYTPCFRREAGSYGAQTKGMIRIHQFDKVELVKITTPEESFKELELIVKDAEAILQTFSIPYRVIVLCTREMSFASAKTYDIELWAPGSDRWLEVSSCSNCTDFQARRAKIRFRDKDGKVKFAHMLNGSGVALPRLFIAILENYQTADGIVHIPEPLWEYTGFKTIEPIQK